MSGWPLWYQLYVALREAGCQFDIMDDTLIISPPLRAPAWSGDIHEDMETHYSQLKRHAEEMKREDAMLRERLREALAKFLKASEDERRLVVADANATPNGDPPGGIRRGVWS